MIMLSSWRAMRVKPFLVGDATVVAIAPGSVSSVIFFGGDLGGN